jgi:hypothetical protein
MGGSWQRKDVARRILILTSIFATLRLGHTGFHLVRELK